MADVTVTKTDLRMLDSLARYHERDDSPRCAADIRALRKKLTTLQAKERRTPAHQHHNAEER